MARQRGKKGAVKRVLPGWVVLLVMLGWAAQGLSAPLAAAVSGVVHDVHGTPQMGTLIELLAADATPVASTLTDDHGRFILPSVLPGRYELRATAAFFVPVTRSNLSLRAGAQAIVNLTMSTLFEAANWLPAERRAADEPVDDWKWTLRSTASRPLLRLTEPEDGLEVSSSAAETHKADTQARLSVVNGDGEFGYGGVHQVLTMDRIEEDGDGAIFRADLGDPQSPITVRPMVDVLAGYQRQLPLGGRTRIVAGFASHPELMAAGVAGLEVLRLASAQEMALGDAVLIDAGTLLEAERLEATRRTNTSTAPFARVLVRPGGDLAVEYRFATDRALQTAGDLDHLKPSTAILADAAGRALWERGHHHELSVSRRFGDSDVLTAAAYHDALERTALQGRGAVDGETMQGAPIVADPTTLRFVMTGQGYTGRGMNVAFTHSLTPALKATMQYAYGTALRADRIGAPAQQLCTHGEAVSAASFSLHGKILRSGTALNAEYRWQPVGTLTQVDPYDTGVEEGYLGFALRQKIWGGRLLPHGLDAVLAATNLLEQGYQPVLAPDGHTLLLAQVPRAIQAGLAFNF